MAEFLIRNYLAGVDRFIVYDDDVDELQSFNLVKILGQFSRIVTYLPRARLLPLDEEISDTDEHVRMYKHCVQMSKNFTKWMTFVDADKFFGTEYLDILDSGEDGDLRTLFTHKVLLDYDEFPKLCIRWPTFLTNVRILPAPRGSALADCYTSFCEITTDFKHKLTYRKSIV